MTPSSIELKTGSEVVVYRANRSERVSCVCTGDAIWSLYQGETLVGQRRSSHIGELGGTLLPSEVQFSVWPGATLKAQTTTAGTIAVVLPVLQDCQCL